MASGDSDNQRTILKILQDLKDPNIPLKSKYRKQNEFKNLVRSNSEIFELAKIALEEETGFVFRKLLLDCHLETRNIQYLVDFVMKSAEPILIKHALAKHYWVFKEESSFNDPKFFLDELLPAVSFTTRHLILWQIQKNYPNQAKCDELYQAIDNRIGPSVANILLPACSPSFVANVIESKERLSLTGRQLSLLLRKHPAAGVQYLKTSIRNYPMMLARIAKIDPVAFADIYEKERNIGRGFHSCRVTTNYLLKGCFQRILDNPKIYSALLHKPTLFKLVGKDHYIKFLISSFPDTLEDFKGYDYGIVSMFEAWVNFLPPKVDRGELFKAAFELRYGAQLIDCPDCISPSMLKIFSTEDRDTFSDLKLATIRISENSLTSISVQKAQWIACKPIEKSIPQLKVLISGESDHFNRQQLLGYLIKACSINRDGVALNQVCKYYVDRHRNERQDTHARFISEITTEFDGKDLELDQAALHYFVEILKVYIMNLEKGDYVNISESLLEKIYFAQVDNCLSTSWVLPILFRKKLDEILAWRPYWIFNRKEHLNDNYLCLIERMVERIDSLPLKSPDDWCRFITAILLWSQDWNRNIASRRKKPNNKLPLNLSIKHFPNIEEKLQELADKTTEISKNILDQFVTAILKDSSLARDPSNPIYTKCLEMIPNAHLILHFLKHNTVLLNQNWEMVSKCLFAVTTKYTDIVTRLHRNGYEWNLFKLRQEFDLKVMDSNIEGAEKVHMVGIASLMFSTEIFLDWIEKYYPKAVEANTSTHYPPDTFLSFMALRKGICRYLKNVECPSRVLPALLAFCAGDYLKLTLGSLYSIVVNSDFVAVKEFLLELSQRPAVSVKKHGIRLMSLISFKDGLCKFLTDLWANDEHPTTRSVILAELLKRLDYDEAAWKTLMSRIDSLSSKDGDSLLLLSGCDVLAHHHLEEYGNVLWKKYQEKDLQMKFHLAFVGTWVKQNFERLSPAWLQHFLSEQNLFMESEAESEQGQRLFHFQEAVVELLIQCLVNFPGNQKQFLSILDTNLKGVAPPALKPKFTGIGSSFKMVDRFIQNLCHASFGPVPKLTKDELVGLFQAISEFSIFGQRPPSPFTFSMELFLKLTTRLHGDSENTGIQGKGKILGQVLDESIAEYGASIFPFWAKQVGTFINEIWHSWISEAGWGEQSQSELDVNLDLATGLLTTSSINMDEKTIFTLSLLPGSMPKCEESKEKYLALLGEVSDDSRSFLVQLYFGEWAVKTQNN